MRRALLVVLAFAIVPASLALAQSSGLKVTGGGQVLASGQSTGPGDTIAFNAQQTSSTANSDGAFPAMGQLQVIDRTNSVKFHGTVTCIRQLTSGQDNGFVRFGGFKKVNGQTDPSAPFTVDVQDNGQPNQGQDMIVFRQRNSGDDPCDTSDQNTQLRSTTLARGNVKNH